MHSNAYWSMTGTSCARAQSTTTSLIHFTRLRVVESLGVLALPEGQLVAGLRDDGEVLGSRAHHAVVKIGQALGDESLVLGRAGGDELVAQLAVEHHALGHEERRHVRLGGCDLPAETPHELRALEEVPSRLAVEHPEPGERVVAGRHCL